MTELSPMERIYQIGFRAGWQAKEEAYVKNTLERGTSKWEIIIREVGRYFDINPQSLSLKTRKRRIVFPRHIAMFFLTRYTTLSLKNIGIMLGGKDHTTVIHARNLINDLIKAKDRETVKAVVNIEIAIKSQKEEEFAPNIQTAHPWE